MYEVIFTDSALKELKKLDKPVVRVIKKVVKNLVDCVDPRIHGKPLKGNLKGVWRYRVGDYRLFADIQDDKLVIFLFEVAQERNLQISLEIIMLVEIFLDFHSIETL